MNHKVVLTTRPGALYFTVDDHLRQAMRTQADTAPGSKAYQSLFQEANDNFRHLMNLPDAYEMVLLRQYELLTKFFFNTAGVRRIHFANHTAMHEVHHRELAQDKQVSTKPWYDPKEGVADVFSIESDLLIINADDPEVGLHFPFERLGKSDQLLAVNLSQSVTNVPANITLPDMLFFHVNAAMGLPFHFYVAFVKKEWIDLSYWDGSFISDLSPLELYTLAKVSGDWVFKGLEQINRETNYKSAVLRAIPGQCALLNPPGYAKHLLSKYVFAATLKGDVEKIESALAANHFKVNLTTTASGTGLITIANYPTSSKEQIERLADVLTAL